MARPGWLVKFTPEQATNAKMGCKVTVLLFLKPPHQMGWMVKVTHRTLYPWGRPGGWVGPKAGLDKRRNSRLPPGFDPRNVQPVASSNTDWGQAVDVIVWTAEAAFTSETTAVPWENVDMHKLLVQYAYTNARYRSIWPILQRLCILIGSFFIRRGTII